MLIQEAPKPRDALRQRIDEHYRKDEAACVAALLDEFEVPPDSLRRIDDHARRLVEAVRRNRRGRGGIDAFLHEYGLSTEEGVLLMCVAEALLRVPDHDTQERLIRDKISIADWDKHLGHSRSLFVNASTMALMLTGRVVGMHGYKGDTSGAVVRRMVARLGEPVVREAVNQAMRILGRQFVMSRDIEGALERAKHLEARGYTYSYDMLGEAARTDDDAQTFFASYRHAIEAIGRTAPTRDMRLRPGISVKLSALHARFEVAQRARVMDELLPRLESLALQAAEAGIGFNIDAEEADRLDLSLDLIEAVSGHSALKDWPGFGVVVQAYQKRAPYLIDWLADMAERHGRRLMVRLVKGAYWDTEIKRAQEAGLEGYPVFTRKPSTDVCYLACAKRLLARMDVFYPQFATHNAHTIASVIEYAGNARDFEFQRLHGMGEALYEEVVERGDLGVGCRIYAPVGRHAELLAYLVRRLLENGANSSFVNRLQDDRLPIEEIIQDPIAQVRGLGHIAHPRIPLPRHILEPLRLAAKGVDTSDLPTLWALGREMAGCDEQSWSSAPIIAGETRANGARPVHSPADRTRVVGEVGEATPEHLEAALSAAESGAVGWAERPVEERAAVLERAASLMEERMAPLLTLCVREAGKTLGDAIAEVREAADFLRYYAARARHDRSTSRYEGARHAMAAVEGRRVIACISPWNFPLAIFTGQIAAALVTGNAVIAKPAEQTPLIAAAGIRLLHEAGVPVYALHLLPGDGERVGAPLVADPRIGGVCFTGSTEVAQSINRTLARRGGAALPLIAETGGLNAMIVDSTALPEQVTRDVVISAFQSAGQRCSALRVLFVQDDVAEDMLEMITGAMDELTVGDPAQLSTDIGPVIDDEAKAMLEAHIKRMVGSARVLKRLRPGVGTGRGSFVGPAAFEIDSLSQLQHEVFGPILHVVRYESERLDKVIDAINATGYGLTFGVHSRIEETWRHCSARTRVGNVYVNRNQIGAVVGVQPFGGRGLSGTGPKAGGPLYLPRFMRVHGDAREPDGEAAAGEAPRLQRSSLDAATARLRDGWREWAGVPAAARAVILERAAATLEPRDAQAADHLHAIAAQLRAELGQTIVLPGPTGERNEYGVTGRGVVACLDLEGTDTAVMTAAALAAGNGVIVFGPDAPAFVETLQAAGVPTGAIAALAPGSDAALEELLMEPALAAVASNAGDELADAIARKLAEREGAICPLIRSAPADGALGAPPAGSRHFLYRFVDERTISIDTTAAGGNASLLALAGS